MEPACSGALVVSGGGDGASIERRRPWRRKLPPLPRASPSRVDRCAFLPVVLLGSLRQGEWGSHAGEPRREALATEEPRRRPVKRDDTRRGMGVGVAN